MNWFPHRFCLNNDSHIITLSIIGNLAIALAYYSIPVALVWMVKHKLVGPIISKQLFLLFSTFIFLCGTTHIVDIVVIWYPWYILQVVVNLLTGIVSIATAVILVFKIITLSERLKEYEKEVKSIVDKVLA